MGSVVTIRNLKIGEGIPKICVPLTDSSFDALMQSVRDLSGKTFDLVEWRADFYQGLFHSADRLKVLRMLREELGEIPVLFTIRTADEGGQAKISLDEYLQINQSVIESGLADLVDVELSKGPKVMTQLCNSAHQFSVRIVGSKHDFAKTPPESEIVDDLCHMQALGADIAKFAVMPTCERDVLTLLSATIIMKEQHPGTPVITMSMGQLGAFSRVCGSLSGSAVTFGTAGNASAPGQLPAGLLKTILETLA